VNQDLEDDVTDGVKTCAAGTALFSTRGMPIMKIPIKETQGKPVGKTSLMKVEKK